MTQKEATLAGVFIDEVRGEKEGRFYTEQSPTLQIEVGTPFQEDNITWLFEIRKFFPLFLEQQELIREFCNLMRAAYLMKDTTKAMHKVFPQATVEMLIAVQVHIESLYYTATGIDLTQLPTHCICLKQWQDATKNEHVLRDTLHNGLRNGALHSPGYDESTPVDEVRKVIEEFRQEIVDEHLNKKEGKNE